MKSIPIEPRRSSSTSFLKKASPTDNARNRMYDSEDGREKSLLMLGKGKYKDSKSSKVIEILDIEVTLNVAGGKVVRNQVLYTYCNSGSMRVAPRIFFVEIPVGYTRARFIPLTQEEGEANG